MDVEMISSAILTPRASRRAWLAAGALVSFAMVLVVGSAVSRDQRISQCGGSNPANRVVAAFELDHARDFWTRFPAAPRGAPELEVDTPVFVVVFDGVTDVAVLAGPGGGLTAARLPDVVCVLMPASSLYPDGEPLVYYNVSREGFTP
jgi:hypothetical protein